MVHITTLDEARTIAKMYESNAFGGSHENVLVLFAYPEHASCSVGVCNIQLLNAMAKDTHGDTKDRNPQVKEEVQRLSNELKKELNDRLAKAGYKERVVTDDYLSDEEEWHSGAVWFYKDDASMQRMVWLREKLRRIDIYVFIVSYGSSLHENIWLQWVQD